jgi:hypothetical protein
VKRAAVIALLAASCAGGVEPEPDAGSSPAPAEESSAGAGLSCDAAGNITGGTVCPADTEVTAPCPPGTPHFCGLVLARCESATTGRQLWGCVDVVDQPSTSIVCAPYCPVAP